MAEMAANGVAVTVQSIAAEMVAKRANDQKANFGVVSQYAFY
jgi:hypothetical protein